MNIQNTLLLISILLIVFCVACAESYGASDSGDSFAVADTRLRESAGAECKESALNYLILNADLLVSVTVLDEKDMTVIAELSEPLRTKIRQAIRVENINHNLSLTPPPWDVLIRLSLTDGTIYYAVLAARYGLRFNSNNVGGLKVMNDNHTSCENVVELVIGEDLFQYLRDEMAVPINKEYQIAPGSPWLGGSK